VSGLCCERTHVHSHNEKELFFLETANFIQSERVEEALLKLASSRKQIQRH